MITETDPRKLNSDVIEGDAPVFFCVSAADVARVIDVAAELLHEWQLDDMPFGALTLTDASVLLGEIDEIKARNGNVPPFVLVPDDTDESRSAIETLRGQIHYRGHIALMADLQTEDVRDVYARLLDTIREREAEIGPTDEQSYRVAQEMRVHDTLQARDGYRRRIGSGAYDRIQTGVGFIDDLLGGGLSTVVTMFGARTGIGKTTMCLQIADSLAASGRHVLYAALEMTADELAAKSIARIHNETADNFVRYRDLLENRVPDKISPRAIRAAEDKYFDWAETYMHVMDGRRTAAAIERTARDIAEVTGQAPVVFVDYLQYLLPSDARLTDKQATDANVNGLKRICQRLHTPVIAISSLNRASYGGRDVKSDRDWFDLFEAGCKESGGIEYTAEIQLFMRRLEDTEQWDNRPEWEYPTRLYLGKNRAGQGFKTCDVVLNGWRGSFGQWGSRDATKYKGDAKTLFDVPTERQAKRRR